MALEGQLSDFNLAEIFQLIAGQQKTGFLVLEAQQEMVFVFDKGILVSTRDRRNTAEDPLQNYLQNYGFFDARVWSHIEFVKQNSSLDLTEILISEKIVGEKDLKRILQSLAVEMTHRGMKLKKGHYHFTATRETPQGARDHIEMNVQSVLMEAARRLDEEHKLAEAFPTPAVTFQAGPITPPESDVKPSDQRLLDLALSGEPLAQIVRRGKLDAFTAKERLLTMCEDGMLQAILPESSPQPTPVQPAPAEKVRQERNLRSVTLTLAAVVLLLGAGFWRWQPWLSTTSPSWGLPGRTAEASATPRLGGSDSVLLSRDLRLRQIQDDLVQALELFRYRHGKYPLDLSLLVKEELLAASTYRTIFNLGWSYQLQEEGRDFSLAS